MPFKKYKDFIESIHEDLTILTFGESTINEKSMDFPVDKKILNEPVAIYVSTYNIADNNRGRGNYITFEKMLGQLLDSIKSQTYKNWKLFITGDCFEPEEELVNILKSKLDPKQYTFHNLSKPGERGIVANELLHLSGGCAANNKGISLAKSEGFKYFAHIDHDDVWKPTHLESMMQAFQQDPDIAFGYHRSSKKRIKGNGAYYIWGAEGRTPTLYYDDIPNKLREAPHSGIVWHGPSLGWPKYRNAEQNTKEAPKRDRPMAGDEDFIYQCVDAMKERSKKAIYVPKLLVRQRNAKGQLSS